MGPVTVIENEVYEILYSVFHILTCLDFHIPFPARIHLYTIHTDTINILYNPILLSIIMLTLYNRVDCHVIAETVNLINDYTGIRVQ